MAFEALPIGIVHMFKNLSGRFVVQAPDQSFMGEDLFRRRIHDWLKCHRKLKGKSGSTSTFGTP